MRGFWRRKDLEGQLRHSRPVPPEELVNDIVSRIEGSQQASRTRAPFRRLGLAGIAAVAMVTVLGVFGGAGFAASGVSGAAASTADAVSTLVRSEQKLSASNANSSNRASPNRGNRGGKGCKGDDNGNDDFSAARGQYCPPRMTICHVKKRKHGKFKQQTLTLPARAAERHLRNHPRDYEGPCVDDGDDGDDTSDDDSDDSDD